MNRRKKIIFFVIIAIIVCAILWFFYNQNKQSQNVKSENGNVSSLFPFTGTNVNYQTIQNGQAPQNLNGGQNNSNLNSNNNSNSNLGSGLNNNFGTGFNNNFGSTGGGFGSGNTLGFGNLTNVLNPNDLSLNNDYSFLGLPSCSGNSCFGNPNIPNNPTGPNGGSVTLTANQQQYFLNVDNKGGSVNLDWTVVPGSLTSSSTISCVAQSSDGTWSGSKSSTGGSETVQIEPNITSSIISHIYTLNCTNGDATVTVEQGDTSGQSGGNLNFSINNSYQVLMSSSGGPATLSWNISSMSNTQTQPGPMSQDDQKIIANDQSLVANTQILLLKSINNSASTTDLQNKINSLQNEIKKINQKYYPVICQAKSSAGDWNKIITTATGTDTVTLPSNTGTSTLSQTYTLDCSGSGLGSQTVTANVDISADAFLDRTPSFQFTANGASDLTITPGTPVELDWQVKNIDASSCKGTSDNLYAGWGKNYSASYDATSTADATNLSLYATQLSVYQSELDALQNPSGTSTSIKISPVSDILAELNAQKTELASTTVAINTQNTTIGTLKTSLSTASTTITNLGNQLSKSKSILTDPASSLSQISTASTTVATITSSLPLLKATQSSFVTELDLQQNNLGNLIASSTTIKNTITSLTTLYNNARSNSTASQINSDLSNQIQIETLQHNIALTQANIDAINQKYSIQHLHLVSASGNSIKDPLVNVGTDAKSYSEIAGLENTVITGTLGGLTQSGLRSASGVSISTAPQSISGGDGSGGGIVGDVPITSDRVYTLTCGNLPPQSVSIHVDNSQGNVSDNSNPSLTFLANGSQTVTVNVGDPVKLSWQVSNISANSCVATSDGLYEGWGSTKQKIRSVRTSSGNLISGKSSALQPGDIAFYTDQLVPDPGGTIKSPTSDVGSNPQTFSEVVGADNSITTTRTYTLTCGDLPPQTVTINVNNSPSLVFTVDGQTQESVATGTSATLSWSVSNIKGGSCIGTSNNSYSGWDSAGTSKSPSTDVGSVPLIFNEVIGKDGSINGSEERTYTLTCTGDDGSTVTQTVDINGPDLGIIDNGNNDNNTGNNGDNGSTTGSDNGNPCDADLDIKTAEIQLTSLVTEYHQITGNNYNLDAKNNFTGLTHDTTDDYLDQCMTDTVATWSGGRISDFETALNNSYYTKEGAPTTRTVYDSTLFNPSSTNNFLDSVSQAIPLSNVSTSSSFLSNGWFWLDDGNFLDPSVDGDAGSQWTNIDDGSSVVASSDPHDPNFAPNVHSSYVLTRTNSLGKTEYGIYIGDLVDLVHLKPTGDPDGVCPSNTPPGITSCVNGKSDPGAKGSEVCYTGDTCLIVHDISQNQSGCTQNTASSTGLCSHFEDFDVSPSQPFNLGNTTGNIDDYYLDNNGQWQDNGGGKLAFTVAAATTGLLYYEPLALKIYLSSAQVIPSVVQIFESVTNLDTSYSSPQYGDPNHSIGEPIEQNANFH